jgi:DNA-binding NarL/FixJ family response regulator
MVLAEWPGLTVVGEAEDGISGLQKVMDLVPDVVLLDIGLPLIDGIECVNRIKATALSSRIMMRSSREEDSAILAALAAGADGYCLKDSSDQLLIEGIKCLAQGLAWLDPRIARRLASLFAPGCRPRSDTGVANNTKITLLDQELALLNEIANRTFENSSDRTSSTDQGVDRLHELMKKIGSHKNKT